jgi:hypothetical protein
MGAGRKKRTRNIKLRAAAFQPIRVWTRNIKPVRVQYTELKSRT